MLVIDFIKKLEELGYDDKTELKIGACSKCGEWHEFKIEYVDDEREAVKENYLVVDVDVDSKFIQEEQDTNMIEMIDDLQNVISKYRL